MWTSQGINKKIFLPLLSVALLQLVSPASAQEAPAPGYAIKQDQPSLGTHIKRNEVTGPLPFNKSYADLSDDQRQQFRSLYDNLAETDEPPFPEQGLSQLYGPISKAQQKLAVIGFLSLYVYVDAEGNATKVEVMASPSDTLTRFAISVAMQTKFKPARCKGTPCEMPFPLRTTLTKRL